MLQLCNIFVFAAYSSFTKASVDAIDDIKNQMMQIVIRREVLWPSV